MNDKFMNGLLTFAGKMQANKVLSAIKDAFIDNMPVVIMGSFCTLFQWVITTTIPGYPSLANIPGMAWLHVLEPIFTTANYGCMNFMAVSVCVLVSIHFAENLGLTRDNTVPAVALASFITLVNTTAKSTMSATALVASSSDVLALGSKATDTSTVPVSISSVVASSYTSATGLFVGLIVGILATLLYVKLIQGGKLKITLPDSVPPNVAQSFAVLFPAVITIFAVAVVGFLVSLSGIGIFDVINQIFKPLQAIMTGLPGYLVIVFIQQLLWWFGIHGPNVMMAITSPFMMAAYAANNALYGAGVAAVAGASGEVAGQTLTYSAICNPFASCFTAPTGSGITGGLLIAIFLFSKRDDYKAIAKLAIPCGIFNINEPVIFGIPMVMNPILGIPFFLAPIASVAIGYFFTKIGFMPCCVVDAPWTTPVGILGFLATGGKWQGAVTQLIALAATVLIYAPFVIVSNRQVPTAEEAAA